MFQMIYLVRVNNGANTSVLTEPPHGNDGFLFFKLFELFIQLSIFFINNQAGNEGHTGDKNYRGKKDPFHFRGKFK